MLVIDKLKKDSVIYYVNQDSEIININLNKNNGKKLVNKSDIQEMGLLQNYPNPFNPSTIIRYELPKSGLVTLKVFDMLGREVKTLVNEYKNSGSYSVRFNAANLTSGVYVYKLQVNDYSTVKKLILLR